MEIEAETWIKVRLRVKKIKKKPNRPTAQALGAARIYPDTGGLVTCGYFWTKAHPTCGWIQTNEQKKISGRGVKKLGSV